MHLDEDRPSVPPLARYCKTNSAAWYPPETSSTQRHAFGVAPAYGNEDAFMSGKSQNSRKEFSFSCCNSGIETHSGAPVANTEKILPPSTMVLFHLSIATIRKRGKGKTQNIRGKYLKLD